MSHLQPALYDPTLVFYEENDHQRNKLAMDFKMYEIAKAAGEQKITLKVMTNDETFIGTVSSIDVKDETHLIHFEGCRSATNGQYLSQRQYFTFDILQMEEAVEAPYPESDFNLLPESSQIQGLTNIPETQEEESHTQSPEDLSQDNPISNIPMYQTPDEEYSLPLQSDGSIDLDFLKLTWKSILGFAIRRVPIRLSLTF